MSVGSTPLGVSHMDGSSLVIQHGDWAALWLAEVTLRVQPPKGATGFLPWRLVVAKAAAPPIKAEAESRRNFNLIDLRVNKQSWFMIPGVVTMSWYDSIPIVSQSSVNQQPLSFVVSSFMTAFPEKKKRKSKVLSCSRLPPNGKLFGACLAIASILKSQITYVPRTMATKKNTVDHHEKQP
jgi:hypothetical protein